MTWMDVKTAVEQYTGLHRDLLHIHVALLLYMIFVFSLQRGLRSPVPWLLVFTVELINEGVDLHDFFYEHGTLDPVWGPPIWEDSLKDVWNTMLWPTVLLLIGYCTPAFARTENE